MAYVVRVRQLGKGEGYRETKVSLALKALYLMMRQRANRVLGGSDLLSKKNIMGDREENVTYHQPEV